MQKNEKAARRTQSAPSDIEFVERSIAHQLGDLSDCQFITTHSAIETGIARSSGTCLGWNMQAQSPYGEPWHVKEVTGSAKGTGIGEIFLNNVSAENSKPVRALKSLVHAGADFDVLMDMQDRRVRPALIDKQGFPIFSFHRLKGDNGRILWPLAGYHDIDGDEFLGNLNPEAVAWEKKSQTAVWRGSAVGRANPEFDVRREGVRLKSLFRKHRESRISTENLEKLLPQFPRIRLVMRYFTNNDYDIGFTGGNGFDIKKSHLISAFQKPKLSRREHQDYKYILVLRGMDLGSSFFWTMNSGSLGLIMETPYDSFASCHFRAWEHYVPFKEDLSDLEENLDWCEMNQTRCREMVKSAAEMCHLLARSDLRAEILKGVVDGVRSKMSSSASRAAGV